MLTRVFRKIVNKLFSEKIYNMFMKNINKSQSKKLITIFFSHKKFLKIYFKPMHLGARTFVNFSQM